MPVKDLHLDDKYLNLSPEARRIVFDQMAEEDEGFKALSSEAQELVRGRIAGGEGLTPEIPVSFAPGPKAATRPPVTAKPQRKDRLSIPPFPQMGFPGYPETEERPSALQRLATGPVAKQLLRGVVVPLKAVSRLVQPLVPFPEMFKPETYEGEGRIMEAISQPFPEVLSKPIEAGLEAVRKRSPNMANLLEGAIVTHMATGLGRGLRPRLNLSQRAFERFKGRKPESRKEITKAIREEPLFLEEVRRLRKEERAPKPEEPIELTEVVEKPKPEPIRPLEEPKAPIVEPKPPVTEIPPLEPPRAAEPVAEVRPPEPSPVEPVAKVKEPFEMTREEFRGAVLDKDPLQIVNMPEWLAAHKKGVEKATTEGKPVPPEVLKDYPDLQPKIVKAPKAKVATFDQSLSSFTENLGGVSIQKSGALAGEFRGLRESGPKGKRVIKAKAGRSPDELAQAAEEAGFIEDADVRTYAEALDRDLRGETVFSTKGDKRMRKIELEGERELARGDEILTDQAAQGYARDLEQSGAPLAFEGKRFDKAEVKPGGEVRLTDDVDITLTKPEDILSVEKQPVPRFEPTEAGMQGVLAKTPGREIPKTGIRVGERRKLTPLEEAAAERERPQGKLFQEEVLDIPIALGELPRADLIPVGKTWVRIKPSIPYHPTTPQDFKPGGRGRIISNEDALDFGGKFHHKVEGTKPTEEVPFEVPKLEKGAEIEPGADLSTSPLGDLVKKGFGPETGVVGRLTEAQARAEAGARAARREIFRRLQVEAQKAGESLEGAAARLDINPAMIARMQSEAAADRTAATSIKNATIDRELAEVGLPPATHGERLSFEEAIGKAEQIVQADPFAGKRLVDDLTRVPRPVTATEDALLLREQTRLKNERILAEDELISAQRSGDETLINEAKARVAGATGDFMTLADVVTKVGTESSLSLGHRRMMMKADYSLAAMERAKQVANDGKTLTEAQRAEVKKAYEEQAATQKAFEEYVARAEARQAEIESELTHARLLAEAKEAAPPEIDPAITSLAERIVVSLETEAGNARIRLREKLSRLTTGLDPTIVADASIIGAAKIARGAVEFGRWSKVMVDDLGEKIRPFLQAVWDASNKQLDAQIARVAGKKKEPVARVIKRADVAERMEAAREQIRVKVEAGEDVFPQAQLLARMFVEQGIKDRNALIDAVHAELKEFVPEIARRDVMDAISGYGRYKQLSKDEISVQLRDLKGQMQQVAKLEDIENSKPPLKTGVERRAPSDAERELIQQVNEAKRRYGIVVTDPATQLQSALGARKTYYRNQISDLEAQIARKEKFVKEKSISPTDAELNKLKARRNQLKKEFDGIFGKPRLSDQQRVILAMRAVGKSIVDLEKRIESGDVLPRARTSKTPSTPELEAMRARRDALREQMLELREAIRPKKTPEQIALQSLKTRLKNQTADMLDRLAREDFEKKPKRTTEMDAEATRLAFENAKVKQTFNEALMKDRLAHRTMPEKIIGGIGETWNTSRVVMTSLDLSAVLRQGGFTAMAHPIRALKAFPSMFRALASEKGQYAVNQEILSRENFPLYKRSGLFLATHEQTLSKMEEVYMSRFAEKIPLIAASQRAYTTFLNRLRTDSFDAMARTLGRTREITREEAKAIANFVNVSTGRGSLGLRENANVGLNTIFFAPRYVASRFQLLMGQPFFRGTARTRKLIAQEYARTLIGLGMVYGLSNISGAEVEIDPRSSDFGKIKVGNTRIDPLFGLAQVTVLLSRVATGETKTLRRGRVRPLRGERVPYGGQKTPDVIARFLRSKLSPVVGTGISVLSGENYIGEPITPESLAGNLLVPLAVQDIFDAIMDQGVSRGVALGMLAIFGMGLQTFDVRKKRRRDPRTFGQRLEGLGKSLGVIEPEPLEAVR